MQICLLKWSKWRFSLRPMQKFLFLPDDEVAKTATSGCCHVPLAWNLTVAPDNLMGWGTELGTGIWTKFPLSYYFTGPCSRDNFSEGWAQCCQSCTQHSGTFLASDISLRRLSHQVQMLWTTLLWRGCSHSPSQPCGLWFIRSAGSKGRKCTCCSACLPGACRPGPQIWKSVCASDSTLRAGSPKTCQGNPPGPQRLLLLMQGLHPSSLYLSISCIAVFQRHAKGRSWWQEGSCFSSSFPKWDEALAFVIQGGLESVVQPVLAAGRFWFWTPWVQYQERQRHNPNIRTASSAQLLKNLYVGCIYMYSLPCQLHEITRTGYCSWGAFCFTHGLAAGWGAAVAEGPCPSQWHRVKYCWDTGLLAGRAFPHLVFLLCVPSRVSPSVQGIFQ